MTKMTRSASGETGKSVRVALPLGREHMPTDYSISLAAYTGRGTDHETRIPDDFGPKQSLRGFESTYQNIIDYIVRITYRIWEDRDVGYIRDTYHNQSQVFDDYGLQLGCEKIVSDTEHTTGAFSDIKLIADEIIWAGNDDIGFHTSHRVFIRGTNDSASKYGPATNKQVDVWCVANCVALDNEIFLEHVIYNTSSLLTQLGFDLKEVAASLAQERAIGWSDDPVTWQALRSSARPEQPISVSSPVSGFDVDDFARTNFDRIWNRGALDTLNSVYDPNFTFNGPTERNFRGLGPYQEFLSSFFSMFPDLALDVDEVYWMGNDKQGYLSSERWSATGTHLGDGIYGAPTHRPVHIWGITQHKIVAGRIVEEWMLFNELDLMMQLSATGARS